MLERVNVKLYVLCVRKLRTNNHNYVAETQQRYPSLHMCLFDSKEQFKETKMHVDGDT